MDAASAVAALAILTTGASFLAAVGARPSSRALFWATAWAAGALLTGLVVLGAVAAGLGVGGARIAVGASVAAWAVAGVLGAARRRAAARATPPPFRVRPAQVFVALASLAALAAAAAFSTGPIFEGDEADIWAARAHALWAALRGADSAEAAARYAVEHPDYPPLNPALQLLTYVVAGDMLHFVARLPMQLSGSAIALGVYGAVATAAGGRAGGVAGALAVAALLGQEWFRVAAQSGMSDGMVAAGLLLAAAWWASWRDGRRRRDAACAALMTAFLASSKHEGALLATLLGLVVLAAELRARGRDALRSVAVLAPLSALVPPAAHVACLRRLGASNDMVEGLAAPDRAATAVARIPEVAALTWERLVSLSEAGGALVVAAPIVALLAARRGASSAVLIGAWTAALGGAAYFAVFLLTPRELRWHFESAAPRLCGHLVPTALVALATAACAAAGTRGDARAPAATVEAD